MKYIKQVDEGGGDGVGRVGVESSLRQLRQGGPAVLTSRVDGLCDYTREVVLAICLPTAPTLAAPTSILTATFLYCCVVVES